MGSEKASYLGGILAGIVGLLVFLVLHHLWIKPIWFIGPIGLVTAVFGGLAVGWAHRQLLPSLPKKPWRILTWAALVGFTLTPAVILAQLRPPVSTAAGILNISL